MAHRSSRGATYVASLKVFAVIAGLCGAGASHAAAYPSTYHAPAAEYVVLRGATVLTGTGQRLNDADVLLGDGLIQAVGQHIDTPAKARVIDARGKWITPGLIDVHSHLGVAASWQMPSLEDVNERTAPITANVWVEHSIWPQDPGFEKAREGGVTTLQILPGSGNLVGGRAVTIKNVAAVTYQAMKFPNAPQGLKMACGENPKKNYGSRQQSPMTRMGNMAVFRQGFAEAQDYRRQRLRYEADLAEYNGSTNAAKAKPPAEPKRDLRLETLAAVLDGELLVNVHCYRADEMASILDLAQEFGFKIGTFHHAVEAYKIADLLASSRVCAAMWADWWGFKLEAFDGIQENIAFVEHAAEGCAIVHSDSAHDVQRLNQEAAKAMFRSSRLGWPIAPECAIRWLTLNSARALGIESRTGSLESGKMADVVVWNGNPFSAYALAERVFIDGAEVFDRSQRRATPASDFSLGFSTEERAL
ncbi:amidohydrolase [Steroidobacter sp.]|uniref:amidohydrolase n=1 Tax=Steroidobacter sp. TaxID=1978227 RepID=UPI001A56811B|nr:amidohydrolase [Steroidobacter sp.]MBL8271167.1 amidohydrolase [Steroidobacter sp.]